MADETEATNLPCIVYVDERQDARDDFFTDAYQSGLFEEIHVLPPEPTIALMIEILFDLKIDALISDFRLTDAGPVDYNGEELVEAVLAKRAGFPCFIQTSFDDEALLAAEDVNRVYSKIPHTGDGGRAQLLQRVVLQIRHHKERVDAWRVELEELLSIDRKELSSIQVERILEVDDAIEENMGLDDQIARQVKRDLLKDENLANHHSELVSKTEKLIDQMRKALDE